MVFRLIFGLFFVSLALFFVSSNVFAQSVLSCTPLRATVNRDLQVGTSTSSGNLFVSGNAYLGLDSTQAPVVTNTGVTNLLFQTASGDTLFEDRTGNRYAGIYSNVASAPAATNGSRALVVNGTLEGYLVNGRSQLCINGSCVASWSEVNTAANGEDDTRCDTSGTCSQLCIGTECYNTWASAIQNGAGGGGPTTVQMSANSLTVTGGGSIRNGGLYQVCNSSGTGCVGTGRGVSRIIDGDGAGGITVTPASGDGDVTLTASSGTLSCQVVNFTVATSLPGTTSCPGGYLLTGGVFHRQGGSQAGQLICCRVN